LALSFGMTDRSRFTVVPIGSLHTGWALKVDGIIRRSSPSLISLGAYVDAIMAGASEADADNIARAIEARPWPSYAGEYSCPASRIAAYIINRTHCAISRGLFWNVSPNIIVVPR
jgi:hypothetical protein